MFRILPPIVLLFVGVLWLPAWSHGRSISRVGDINVDITRDTFNCDKTVCPTNTHRCVVTKENDANNSGTLVRSSKCYSIDNVVLKQSITKEPIPPYSRIKVHIVAYRNGVTSVTNSQDSYTSTNFDKQQFSQDMSDFHKELRSVRQGMQQMFSSLYY